MSHDRGARRSHLLTRGLRKAGVLSRLRLTTSVLHNGRRIAVPLIDGIGLQHRELTEPHAQAALRVSLAMRTGTFVDVGAHLGETLVKLLAFGRGHPYLGFEPNPSCAAYVDRLLEANGQEGAVLAAAAGSRSGAARLQMAGPTDDSASIVAGFRGEDDRRASRPVPVLRGDEVLESRTDPQGVGVLKIDAEGAELDVLHGFRDAIDRDRPIILCEILPIGDTSTDVARFRRDRARGVAAFAAELDYELLGIAPDGAPVVLPVPSDPAEWDAASPTPDHVLVPRSERERFISAVAEVQARPAAAS